MTEEGFKRKLTSILSADAVGYSRLMEDDEEATVRTLTSYREVIATLIKQHNGMVVDSPGDNLLAEFVSVVDAVQCAVSVQNEITARNEDLPENRKMQFRIGINLGDVIQEGERIYGDGVNIAARLEGLADPGGICISKTAFDQIERKLPYGYEFIGDQTVKNISKPVGAYRVMLEPRVTVSGEPEKEKPAIVWRMPIIIGAIAALMVSVALGLWRFYLRPPQPPAEVASAETPALELPDKPSIAVLPFINLSGDPEQDYFSDGFTVNLIYYLYKIPGMFVIARGSTFKYKGKDVDVRQVGRELGVRYVLEGSVQRAEDRIRVTTQLVDAATGSQLWAERYDRELKDIFAVQDEIMRKVVNELAVKIVWGETWRLESYGTDNYEAFDIAMQGDKYFMRFEKEANIRARELWLKALELDPKYARVMAIVGWTHLCDALYRWVKNPAQSIKQSEEWAHRALAIDDNVSHAHTILGRIYIITRQFEKGIAASKRAVECEPGNAVVIATLAESLKLAGKPEEALVQAKKAIRLSPYGPYTFMSYATAGLANYFTRQYEAAITECKKSLDLQQHGVFARDAWHCLIASYMELGQKEEARAEAKKLLEKHPNFSIKALVNRIKKNYKDFSFLDRHIELLRKAGLPE
jgi:adenylate cyclase